MEKATVTYFYNSGFMVRTGSILLVFDYWRGENESLPVEKRLTEQDFEGCTQIIFFVTHAHRDHFDSVIYDYNYNKYPIRYIVDREVPQRVADHALCQRIHVGDTIRMGVVTVKAFGSTDAGVSLYVRVNTLNIFHAGDLNLWHWRDERSLQEVREARKAFTDCLQPLTGMPVDIAMFPLDPRQGGCYDAGANQFIMTIRPRVFIPMHWQDKPEVASDFCRHGGTDVTKARALTHPRDTLEVTIDGDIVNAVVARAPEKLTTLPNRGTVRLDNLSSSHPFAESDLPIDLDRDRKEGIPHR